MRLLVDLITAGVRRTRWRKALERLLSAAMGCVLTMRR
jgi:hypothetical protein